jgi:hypothetical protein
LARDSAGSNSAARMAMIAITTNSSINVNPQSRFDFMCGDGILPTLNPDWDAAQQLFAPASVASKP